MDTMGDDIKRIRNEQYQLLGSWRSAKDAGQIESRVFYAWRDYASVRGKERRRLTSALRFERYHKLSRAYLQLSFHMELQRTLRLHTALAENYYKHQLSIHAMRCFEANAEWGVWRRHAEQKVLKYSLRRSLSQGLRGWHANTTRSTKKRLADHACIALSLKKAVGKWAKITRLSKHLDLQMDRARQRWTKLMQSQAMIQWQESVFEMRLLVLANKQHMLAAQKKVVEQWANRVARVREERQLVEAQRPHFATRAKQRCLTEWKQSIMGIVGGKVSLALWTYERTLKTKALSAFKRFQEIATDERERDHHAQGLGKRIFKRWFFQEWKEHFFFYKRLGTLHRMALLYYSNTLTFKCFVAWRRLVNTQLQAATKILDSWKRLTMVGGLRQWHQCRLLVDREIVGLETAELAFQSRVFPQALATLKSRTNRLKQFKQKMTEAKLFAVQRSCKSSLQYWKAVADDGVQDRTVRVHMRKFRIHLMIKKWHNQSQQRRWLRNTAEMAMQSSVLWKYSNCWSQWKRAISEREALNKSIQFWKGTVCRKILSQWILHTEISKVQWRIIAQFCDICRVRTCHGAFSRWKRQAADLTLLHKATCLYNRKMKMRSLHAWKLYTNMRQARQDMLIYKAKLFQKLQRRMVTKRLLLRTLQDKDFLHKKQCFHAFHDIVARKRTSQMNKLLAQKIYLKHAGLKVLQRLFSLAAWKRRIRKALLQFHHNKLISTLDLLKQFAVFQQQQKQRLRDMEKHAFCRRGKYLLLRYQIAAKEEAYKKRVIAIGASFWKMKGGKKVFKALKPPHWSIKQPPTRTNGWHSKGDSCWILRAPLKKWIRWTATRGSLRSAYLVAQRSWKQKVTHLSIHDWNVLAKDTIYHRNVLQFALANFPLFKCKRVFDAWKSSVKETRPFTLGRFNAERHYFSKLVKKHIAIWENFTMNKYHAEGLTNKALCQWTFSAKRRGIRNWRANITFFKIANFANHRAYIGHSVSLFTKLMGNCARRQRTTTTSKEAHNFFRAANIQKSLWFWKMQVGEFQRHKTKRDAALAFWSKGILPKLFDAWVSYTDLQHFELDLIRKGQAHWMKKASKAAVFLWQTQARCFSEEENKIRKLLRAKVQKIAPKAIPMWIRLSRGSLLGPPVAAEVHNDYLDYSQGTGLPQNGYTYRDIANGGISADIGNNMSQLDQLPENSPLSDVSVPPEQFLGVRTGEFKHPYEDWSVSIGDGVRTQKVTTDMFGLCEAFWNLQQVRNAFLFLRTLAVNNRGYKRVLKKVWAKSSKETKNRCFNGWKQVLQESKLLTFATKEREKILMHSTVGQWIELTEIRHWLRGTINRADVYHRHKQLYDHFTWFKNYKENRKYARTYLAVASQKAKYLGLSRGLISWHRAIQNDKLICAWSANYFQKVRKAKYLSRLRQWTRQRHYFAERDASAFENYRDKCYKVRLTQWIAHTVDRIVQRQRYEVGTGGRIALCLKNGFSVWYTWQQEHALRQKQAHLAQSWASRRLITTSTKNWIHFIEAQRWQLDLKHRSGKHFVHRALKKRLSAWYTEMLESKGIHLQELHSTAFWAQTLLRKVLYEWEVYATNEWLLRKKQGIFKAMFCRIMIRNAFSNWCNECFNNAIGDDEM